MTTRGAAVLKQGGVSPAATGRNPYETSFCDEHLKYSAKADGEQLTLTYKPGAWLSAIDARLRGEQR
jgi:hypothetical protein